MSIRSSFDRVCCHALLEATIISPIALLGRRQVGRPGTSQTTVKSMIEVRHFKFRFNIHPQPLDQILQYGILPQSAHGQVDIPLHTVELAFWFGLATMAEKQGDYHAFTAVIADIYTVVKDWPSPPSMLELQSQYPRLARTSSTIEVVESAVPEQTPFENDEPIDLRVELEAHRTTAAVLQERLAISESNHAADRTAFIEEIKTLKSRLHMMEQQADVEENEKKRKHDVQRTNGSTDTISSLPMSLQNPEDHLELESPLLPWRVKLLRANVAAGAPRKPRIMTPLWSSMRNHLR